MLINILDRVPKPVIAPTIISCFSRPVYPGNVATEWEQRFFTVRRLPLRAEVTFYSAMVYVSFRQLTSPFR